MATLTAAQALGLSGAPLVGATEPDPIAGAGRGTPARPDFVLAVSAGVFGAQAVASLAAGMFVSLGGWPMVNVVALGPLALMTLVLARSLAPRAAVRERA